MKLGALKSAIRGMAGNPKALIKTPEGKPFEIVIQKMPLLAELDNHFSGGGKAAETGFCLTDSGHFDHERD